MSVRHLVLLAILTSSLPLLAAEKGINATNAGATSSEKRQLSVKMQALLDTIRTPGMALQASREYQQNGYFGLSKIVLQHGIALAKASGSEFVELSTELEYAMPLLQAKELMVMGKPEEAEVILQGLAEKFSTDQRRVDEITALLGALSQSRLLAASKLNNERDVTRDVRKRINEYYRKNGVFPNFSEMNKILPPGDAVLQNYEIVYFKAVPNAYRLVLRNVYNPQNMLKIEATGLLK